MSVTLKKDSWKIKDPNTGEYRDSTVFATTLSEDMVAAVDAQETRATAIVSDLTSDITTQETRVDGIVSGAQADIDTIAAAVQSMTQTGTDTTLTVSGAAADSETVGDEFDKLISRIEVGEYDTYVSWEQGAIASATGVNSQNTSTTRIRTVSYAKVSDFGFRFDVEDGYSYTLAIYSQQNAENGYVGMWNGSDVAESATWLTGSVVLPKEYHNYYFRVCLAKSDSTISTSDRIKFHMYSSNPLRTCIRVNADKDLDNLPSTGVYYWTSSASAPLNSPTANAGICLCIGAPPDASGGTTQIVISRSAYMFVRQRFGSEWTEWYTYLESANVFARRSLTSYLEQPYNIDNVTDIGCYQLARVATYTDGCNPIEGTPGILLHFRDTSSANYYYMQIAINDYAEAYYRYKSGDGWTPWHKFLDDRNLSRESINAARKSIAVPQNVVSSGKWGAPSGSTTAAVIPVPDGVKKISMVVKNSSIIAFLASFSMETCVVGNSVDFDKQYPSRKVFDTPGKVEYRVSDNTKYLYILKTTSGGTDVTPTNITFYYDYVPEFLQELPVLYLTGDTSEMTKDNAVTLDYAFLGLTGTCTVKWQGSSSQRYVKKNYTIKFDNGLDGWSKWATFVNDLHTANGNVSSIATTSRWGSQTKFCTKANWVDPSASRNIVCARLWGQIVKGRVTAGDVTDPRKDAPNYGAIDGFPIEIRINNETAGLYTFNIPKDGWTFAMGEGSAEYVIAGEDNSSSACKWKATSLVDGTDFSVEYAPDGVTESTVAASLNTAITAAINAGSDWETALAPYVDIDSVFDYFIFTCCVNNHDALARNIIYGTYDGVKWFMSAYDLDTTFGVDPYGTKWFDVVNDRNQFAEAANIHRLAYLMYTYSKTKLKARYQELRSTVLSEANVWKTFSNFLVDIPTRDYDIDRNRWPSTPGTNTANLAQYLEYYRMHCAYLDSEIEAL